MANRETKRIAVIGGGFYGCYLAYKLLEEKKFNLIIDIFEKNRDLLQEAGSNNQWRLHLGYHYPRSKKTIEQCVIGAKKFTNDFKKYISYPKYNLYIIHKKSKTSFDQFVKIFKNFKLKFKKFDIKTLKVLKNIDQYSGALNTEEGVIKFDKLNPFLKKKIKSKCKVYLNTKIKKIINSDSKILDCKNNKYGSYDFIMNCTYINPNLSNNNKFPIKYELAGMVEIKNVIKKNIALTIMDGNYVSIYPRKQNTVSLSSVKFTPIKKFTNISNIDKLKKIVTKNKKKYINKILNDLNKYFHMNIKKKKKNLIVTTKVKIKNDFFDQRITLLKKNKNVFHILCGKIDAAPIIYDKIKKSLKL